MADHRRPRKGKPNKQARGGGSALLQEAVAQYHAGRLDLAEIACRRFLAEQRNQPVALHLLGAIAMQKGELDEAARHVRAAIARSPETAAFHNTLANILQDQSAWEEAKTAYERALKLLPGYAFAHNNLGTVLRQLGHIGQAVEQYRAALAANPEYAEAHNNLGNVLLLHQGRTAQAVAHYRSALELKPGYCAALANLANALTMTHRIDEAVQCYEQALLASPRSVGIALNLGRALLRRGSLLEAEQAFDRALSLEPNLAAAAVGRFNARMRRCEWGDYDASVAQLQALIGLESERRERGDGSLEVQPFEAMALPISAAIQGALARRRAARHQRDVCRVFEHEASPGTPERLRIGYISPDLNRHAVGFLMQGLFALHDRDSVSVNAYALTDFHDPVREIIEAGCDHYTNLAGLPHADAAERIHADGIHVLVDLAGDTAQARPEILAQRPAPVQCHFFGYPGTLGAEYTPYHLTHRFVVTPELAASYSEALVFLPRTDYGVPRGQFVIPTECPTRAEVGLPDDRLVFCCLHGVQRIEPEVFGSWMRILAAAPNTVLWLKTSGAVADNLRREASARGVEPSRLVFTADLALSATWHHRLADLWLDTFAITGGTSGVLCAYAGVPVLCLAGATHQARTGAFIAKTAGLDALVVESVAEYEARAIHLAAHEHELSAFRQKLAHAKCHGSEPLFQPEAYVRDLERAYWAMWRQHAAGEPPSTVEL